MCTNNKSRNIQLFTIDKYFIEGKKNKRINGLLGGHCMKLEVCPGAIT